MQLPSHCFVFAKVFKVDLCHCNGVAKVFGVVASDATTSTSEELKCVTLSNHLQGLYCCIYESGPDMLLDYMVPGIGGAGLLIELV